MTRQKWICVAVALLMIGGSTALLFRLKANQKLGRPGLRVVPEEGGKLSINLPERVLNYTSSNVPPSQIEIDILPKDTTFGLRNYSAPDGFQLALSVVMMGVDRTSIHKPEFCLTCQGWQIIGRETTSIPIPKPHPYELPVRKFTTSILVKDPSGNPAYINGLYVFWFVAEDRLTASHLARIGWITYDLLRTGTLPRWAYVACRAIYPPGKEEYAYQRIKEFLAAAVPEFQTATLSGAAPAASLERRERSTNVVAGRAGLSDDHFGSGR